MSSLPGPRTTRTLQTVRDTLSRLDSPVSAQELYRLLHRASAGPGLASIYRALDILALHGEAERIRRGPEDVYVLCPSGHHHHAICTACGRADALRTCALQEVPSRTEAGFHIEQHQTVYYGQCGRCYKEHAT